MTRQPAQSFGAFAETYDRLVSLSAGSVRSFIERVLPEAGRRAVDLGCGTGHHASILATRWFRLEALRRFAGDLFGRRRPVREAVEVLRLQTHPAWLDHVTSDRFLSRSEFRHRYGVVFPGGQFTDLYRACVLTWQDERA